MSSHASPWLDPLIGDYVAARTAHPDPILLDLIEETKTTGSEVMQISAPQGALMGLLVRLTNAKHAVEVGTFTGYSSICIARALPADGTLLCCDFSDPYTQIARRYWERAGVTAKITLRVGEAIDTIRELPVDPNGDTAIDFVFIDADKPSYHLYFEELLKRMRTNGLMLIDNTLQQGLVTKPPRADAVNVKAMQAFNDQIANDARVESFILPISDGLTLVRKK
jgi:caffeoyl-CoA O-methyltransferase